MSQKNINDHSYSVVSFSDMHSANSIGLNMVSWLCLYQKNYGKKGVLLREPLQNVQSNPESSNWWVHICINLPWVVEIILKFEMYCRSRKMSIPKTQKEGAKVFVFDKMVHRHKITLIKNPSLPNYQNITKCIKYIIWRTIVFSNLHSRFLTYTKTGFASNGCRKGRA